MREPSEGSIVVRNALLITAEDDQADRLVTLLGKESMGVSHCRGTRDAFRLLRDTQPDLVIIDFEIPDGGALAVRRLSETIDPERPVILLVPPEIEPEWLLLFDCSREVERPVEAEQLQSVLHELGLSGDTDFSGEPTVPDELEPLPAADSNASPRGFGNVSKELPRELRSKPRIVYRMKPRSEFADPVGTAILSSPQTEVGAESWTGEKVRTALDLASDLSITNFPTLLYKLFANRMTGVLKLSIEGNGRRIFIRDGVPVFAVSELHSDAFAGFLVKNRLLSKEEVNIACDSLVPGQSLPELLAKDKKLSEEALDEAIGNWVREVLVGCFVLTAGKYEFERGDDWIGSLPEYRYNPIRLIAEGIKDTLDTNQLAARLNEQLDQYLVKTEKYHEFLRFFPASETEWRWIDAIDGTKTLRDLTIDAQATVVEFLSLVYALQAADIIDFEGRARRIPARSKRKPDPTITKSGHATDLHGNDEQGVLETGRETPAARFDPPPSPRDAEPEDPEQGSYVDTAEIEAVVADHLGRLSSDDPFYLLDIPRGASVDDVRAAYERFRTRLPVEFVPLLTPAVQKNAHRVRDAVHKAYNRVITAQLKAEFEEQRASSSTVRPFDTVPPVSQRQPSHSIPPGGGRGSEFDSMPPHGKGHIEELRKAAKRGKERAQQAEEKRRDSLPGLDPGEGKRNVLGYAEAYFTETKRLVNRRQWSKALDTIREAADILPHNAAVISLEAWIMFNVPSNDKDKRLEMCAERLNVALTLSESYADAHYYLGVVREAQGRHTEALTCFRTVVEIDPHTRFKAVHKQIQRLQSRLTAIEGS